MCRSVWGCLNSSCSSIFNETLHSVASYPAILSLFGALKVYQTSSEKLDNYDEWFVYMCTQSAIQGQAKKLKVNPN